MPFLVTNAEVGCAGAWLEPPADTQEPSAYLRLVANGYENGRSEPSYDVELGICQWPEIHAADAPLDGYDNAVRADIWVCEPSSPRQLPQVKIRVPGKEKGEVSVSVLFACGELLGKLGVAWTPALRHEPLDSTTYVLRAPRESLTILLGMDSSKEIPAAHFIAASLHLARVEAMRRADRLRLPGLL